MEFKNRPNVPYDVGDKIIWASRSVAVVGVIIVYKNLIPYVLVSRRGPNVPDFKGKMNLVAGYLDWDETGLDALAREAWEETGFDFLVYATKLQVLASHLVNPWSVNTKPTENNQNVSLRYGIVFQIDPDDEFPILTTEYNEIEGESEDPMWLSMLELDEYEWAFNHDQVICDYFNIFTKE